MITPGYVQVMARYNAWQNENIYGSAGRLDDDNRKAHRGAFFGSIHATLNHILWADQVWLSRFGACPPPSAKTITEGLTMFDRFDDLSSTRKVVDVAIESWASAIPADWLEGDLEFYSATFEQTLIRPRAVLVMHLFNHQTHHRGQVHTLLTTSGVKPGVTDLPMNRALWGGEAG